MSELRPIAFVLPQFHPTPENDAWWGKGFTEWTNVTKAKPLFKGHYQPHLPTDLGFYDLRLPQARIAQAELAKEYGIHGFCYYHYWFNGKRLLHEPIDGMLTQPDLDMPFMLCWANENWTRQWDGHVNDILQSQDYSMEDFKNHMRWLCKNVFSDKRYIKVDGKPVFLVYKTTSISDLKEISKVWNEIAVSEYGFPGLYLCRLESFGINKDPNSIGFDASVEFSPHDLIRKKIKLGTYDKILQKLGLKDIPDVNLRDYKDNIQSILNRKKPNYKHYKSVTPGFDNTPRKGKSGVVVINGGPEVYGLWLAKILSEFKPYSRNENFIFINAMNEWAEGNHLEPCIKYGNEYLLNTKKELSKYKCR